MQKKPWTEPTLEKGEDLSFVNITLMAYATGEADPSPYWLNLSHKHGHHRPK